jgi:hypothetical protein
VQEGQLSVALLLSDLNDVKEVSSIFRKLGVIPHFYEDLKTFWNGTAERIPSLCIVDVKHMSDGKLALCDHPAIKAEKMPLVFFYTTNTEPLLISTFDIFSLGNLKKSEQLEGQLRSILKRVNHNIRLEKECITLRKDNFSHIEKIDRLALENQTIRQVDRFQSMVKTLCLELEELRGEKDFFKALEKVLQGVAEISEFSMMELSYNGQKLITPISHVQKFRAIPSVWLGQTCLNGIESFAQNMATQVAIDVMGGDLVSLLVKGSARHPEKVIFIKTKNEVFFNQFDWNMFEAYFNGYYISFKNKLDRDLVAEKKMISTFEAMSFLDQFLFGADPSENSDLKKIKKLDYRLIDVDLSAVVELALKKGNSRFFWHKFESEFINRLGIQVRVDFKVFEFGVAHLGFLVESKNLDFFYDELKEFASKFSYWKYFEDSEGALSQFIRPSVKMIPLSAYAYIQSTFNRKLPTETLHPTSIELSKSSAVSWERDEDFHFLREPRHEV